MLNWFKSKDTSKIAFPKVDIHSHLLAGIDDGSQSLEQSTLLIKKFQELGYTKLITTPHVMSDFFRNTPEIINAKLEELKTHLIRENITINLSAAAEYYLDEDLQKKIETDADLLTLGNRYLLFETNFMTEPFNLKEFIFKATTKGYKLILAHPERYIYLQSDFDKVEDLFNRGIFFQMNISSISGYYSKSAQQLAYKLIDKGWVHFIGSDCHNEQHLKLLEESRSHKYFKKVLDLPLLNDSLLSS